MPALLTRTSTGPAFATAQNASSTDAPEVTSRAITSTGRPASAAAARNGSALARFRMPANTR